MIIHPQNITTPTGSVGVFLKNFTNKTFYGVSSNGSIFTVCPETIPIAPSIGPVFTNSPTGAGLVTASFQFISPTEIGIKLIDSKFYDEPIEGKPVYIAEMNVIIFSTYQELALVKDRYGSYEKLVKAYAADALCLINGSYTVLSILSDDSDFYTLIDHTPVHVPKETNENGYEIAKRHGVDRETFKTHYVFMITNVIRHSIDDKRLEHINERTCIKLVPRKLKNPGEPIILSEHGFIVFIGKDQVDAFLSEYYDVKRYFVEKALEQSQKIFDIELKELNERAKDDKRAMMEVFTMMGGTTIISVLGDSFIKYVSLKNKTDEVSVTAKEEAKGSLITAAATCLISGGIYLLYRKIKGIHRKRKREFEAEFEKKHSEAYTW